MNKSINIKSCYDISKIRAELNNKNENKEIKIRRIENKLNDYTMIILRMNDCENKFIMEQKINELKKKLYYYINNQTLKKMENQFKLTNNIEN